MSKLNIENEMKERRMSDGIRDERCKEIVYLKFKVFKFSIVLALSVCSLITLIGNCLK